MDQATLDSHIRRLRAQGKDDGQIEVKASARDLGSSIWDSVSAFANTAGGSLVLGLAESSGFAPTGGFDPDRVVDQLVEGMGGGGGPGRLTHPPGYSLERLEVDGLPVVAVDIEENGLGEKPCFVTAKGVQGGSFKRVDDKDLKLSASEVFEMQQTLKPQESDRTTVAEAEVSDLEAGLVDQLIAGKRTSKALRGASGRSEELARLNLVNRAGEIRLAGLLVTGTYPQQFLPRLLIDVTVHPETEKSAPGAAVRFIDRVECDGPLPEAIDQAVEVVARNLRSFSVVEGTARRDQIEIPREVLREAIANAVVHREYHELFRGQPVTVDVYPDRVMVTNPGGLWGGKTLQNIDDGTSRCRNQVLMQLLQGVPLSGGAGLTVEAQGSGVPLMINEMRAHALDPPSFHARPDQVSVELRRHGAEVPQLRSWLRELTEEPLAPPEDSALLLAKRDGSVSVADLRDNLRIDSDDARDLLAGLMSRGLLRQSDSESFVLWSDRPTLRPNQASLLEALSTTEARDVHELAGLVGKQPTALRPILRRLVAAGYVTATAPPTSRHRRYLRTS